MDEARPKRRRLPGVNLRAGAVKQARLEAGLSLAQLGKGHVTAPAIYLIETARTRPSLPTLEHIARRTGKPVEYFLAEPTLASDQTMTSVITMSAMVAEGRNQEAIQLGRWLLDQGASAFRLGRIRFKLAEAYLNTHQPDLAEPLLAEARAHFQAINDRASLAECIGAQAALANQRHSKEAVQLAKQALEVCATLNPRLLPLEARLLGVLAAAHMANREWDAAIEAYSGAIETGGPLLDLRHSAKAYGELAAAYQKSGETEAATRYAMRSIALLEILQDRVALGQAEHNIGVALIGRGDFAGAREHLTRALKLADVSSQAQVLLGLCEVSMHEGDVDAAADLARRALAEAERQEDGAAAAEAHVWLGRIADRRGENDAADAEFEQAIHGFQALAVHERLLHTHGVYAEVLERRGELAKAYVHMKQALLASRPRPARHHEGERVSSA
jgi:tetratricopeptide (TPR) repeat protein/DNA-binding XRE family transcriptional regulator